jgi:hypothetical protein
VEDPELRKLIADTATPEDANATEGDKDFLTKYDVPAFLLFSIFYQ